MSQYFRTGDRYLWNPSNRVGRLFAQLTETFSAVGGLPAGLQDTGADEYMIDLPVFAAFIDNLTRQYLGSSHAILRSLQEGYLVTALVLVDRAGGQVAALSEPIGLDPRDLSVGADGVSPLGDVARLRELAAENSRSMPR
ncbi:MAG: hypothetical protein HOU81_06460 [Hamadaea sp.]|uniref:DUF6086 family protein n=1 Tax=Hamadaea sp. TaxID=2024425 RepID=UPI0017B602E1|nr:DUF6086 family protein [Hamadaea sp.]NUR70442.1 hypothetical protein [Hamadaea sp.]NUT20032.1 hypothetical protein [Hamadaea sp.]